MPSTTNTTIRSRRTPLGTSFIENLPANDFTSDNQKPHKTSSTESVFTHKQENPSGAVTRPVHQRRKSLTPAPTLPSVKEADEGNEEARVDAPSSNITLLPKAGTTTKNCVQDDSLYQVIYSTSFFFDSTTSSSFSSSGSDTTAESLAKDLNPDLPLEEVESVPICAVPIIEDHLAVDRWFGEKEHDLPSSVELSSDSIGWTGPCTSSASPPHTSKADSRLEELEQILDSNPSRRSLSYLIKRKPVVKFLSDISREALLAKFSATQPVTRSLLSFNEFTTPAQRRRVHPERIVRSRYGPPDSDALRRNCVERSRLIRAGVTVESRVNVAPKPFLFPRAGHLKHLRSIESTACIDDWNLGYVDISFIKKTLYAFDMRMRVGSDLWVEEEEEIYKLFGGNRDWEMDWDTRWRIATWLLNHEEDDEDEEKESFES